MEAKTSPSTLRKISTPLTTISFVVVAGTGTLMLFHVQDSVLRGPHEVFSILFAVASVTHLTLHWRALLQHVRRMTFWICASICTVVAGLTLLGAVEHEKSQVGPREMMSLVETAPLDRLAPAMGITPGELIGRLEGSGMKVPGPTANLRTVSEASGCSVRDVVSVALRRSR